MNTCSDERLSILRCSVRQDAIYLNILRFVLAGEDGGEVRVWVYGKEEEEGENKEEEVKGVK